MKKSPPPHEYLFLYISIFINNHLMRQFAIVEINLQ